MEVDDTIDTGDEVLAVGNIVYPVDVTEVVTKVVISNDVVAVTVVVVVIDVVDNVVVVCSSTNTWFLIIAGKSLSVLSFSTSYTYKS